MNTPLPPSWPYCGYGAVLATDPVGCTGIHVPGQTACLAHLGDAERTTYLSGLTPGNDIDHRGTPFTEQLLNDLLNALRDPTTGNPHLGNAGFAGAQFSGDAGFAGAQFSGDAEFAGAQFSGDAEFAGAQFSGDAGFGRAQFSGRAGFGGAQFNGDARFGGAQFSSRAWFGRVQFSGEAEFFGVQFSGAAGFDRAQFSWRAGFDEAQFSGHAEFGGVQFNGDAGFVRAHFSGHAEFGGVQFSDHAGFVRVQFNGDAGFGGVQFNGDALFDGAQFSSRAWFIGVQFSGDAGFDRVQFNGDAEFGRAHFSGDARFDGARFEGVSVLGPLVCGKAVVLSGAVFGLPVTLEIAAREVVAERTRWESTATIRLRYATVNLSHAVLSAPAAVTAAATPFTKPDGSALGEQALTGFADVRIASVQGVDAAHLVLTDIDLSDCLFSGAFHLDQIRLEGRTPFAPTPTGWHRHHLWPARWTRRRTLAEEHHWRAQTAGQPALPPGTSVSPRQWHPGPHHPDPARTPDPEDVAALYRQLRKAFEDAKNEPGAADFYYGECEMRRHDTNGTPKGERRLLWGYWLLSGYGLRASRAFGWLIAAMSLTVLLLMGLGLPTHDPGPATTGTLRGSKVSLHTSTPDPTLREGWSERFTAARAEKATRVAINSVVFRSSGQNLTTAGTYIEMTSRLLEPTLLALGALAIRARIKR
ncbi:pentapeptide repeat-containing protein [Streptomyces antimycoticus]|uniref:pentapeptide repeat-containing protein n=1 Tax=Streptomyces antimycoticus TaxID=68175 RepID=UPI0036B71A80